MYKLWILAEKYTYYTASCLNFLTLMARFKKWLVFTRLTFFSEYWDNFVGTHHKLINFKYSLISMKILSVIKKK